MSTDRDTTRIVRSWLRSDENDSADRVLGAVLDRLDATPQRTASRWPARRLSQMNSTVKLTLGVAAAVLVALVGFTIVNQRDFGGPPTTPSPEPTAIPTAAAQQLPSLGDLEAGTYQITDPHLTRRPFTLTVPDGWATEESFVTKGSADDIQERDVMVTSWIVSHVFSDACLRPGTSAENLIETSTAQELVDALLNQGGHGTTGPTEARFGGITAQLIELHVPMDVDVTSCDGGLLRLWPDAGPDLSGGQLTAPGQRTSIYVLEIEGEPMIVLAAAHAQALRDDIAEMERVVDSITFAEPAAP